MYNNLISELSSADPQRREAAIKALARTKDTQVLPILKRYAEREDDPRLQALAVNAGRYIRKHAGSSSATSAAAAPKAKPTSVQSDDPIELLEAAVRASDAHEARRLVNQALSIDPSLEDDATYANFIRNVTLGNDPMPSKWDEKRKRKRDKSSQFYDANLADVMLAVVAMVVMVFLSNTGLDLVMAEMLQDEVVQLVEALETAGEYEMASMAASPESVNLGEIFITNVGRVLVFVLQFTLIMGAMHYAATSFFNNNGSFSTLLERGSWFSAVLVPICTIVMGILLTLVVEDALSYIAANPTQSMEAQAEAIAEDALNFFMNILGIVGMAYVIWGIGMTVIINATYKTGIFGGFLTFIMGQIVLVCGLCTLSQVIGGLGSIGNLAGGF